RRRQAAVAAAQVVDAGHLVRAEPRRRGGPEAGHGGGDEGQVVHPEGELGGGVQAVAAGLVVEEVQQGAAGALGVGGDGGDGEGGADAVLVVDRQAAGAADAVADGFLVSEDQAGTGLDDPFEAGQGLAVADAVGAGDLAEEGGGDDGGGDHALARGVGDDVFGQQPAHLVAGQHAAAAAGQRDADRAPVGVGVVGQHQVGARLGGQGERQVHR